MSVNFANVKSITIPEGSVEKITKSSTVLWEKVWTYSLELSTTMSTLDAGETVTFYESISINPSTGEILLGSSRKAKLNAFGDDINYRVFYYNGTYWRLSRILDSGEDEVAYANQYTIVKS